MSARAVERGVASDLEVLPMALALVHGVLLVARPSIPVIGIALWWNANTISHHFTHRPISRSRAVNALFSVALSLLLGFPQSLWRARHLAHHAGVKDSGFPRPRAAPPDVAAAVALWGALLILAPRFLIAIYLPGFLLGLGLCQLQGYYEHAPLTLSHFGRLYNFLFLNDGYHVEHHRHPGAHWRDLPALRSSDAEGSVWPPVLRWLGVVNLCSLERAVLRSRLLQHFVLNRHRLALQRLTRLTPEIESVGIVGGGLFPRTALILKQVLPDAKLILIDKSVESLSTAQAFLPDDVKYVNERFDADSRFDFDLVVIPLSFAGDRKAIYERPPARTTLVHDWIWNPRGKSTVVSWLLLKRLNLVTR